MDHKEFKNQEEFRQYVMSEARKYLFAQENIPADNLSAINEDVKNTASPVNITITPEEIDTLAEEIMKINKKIDLRNPLISESDKDLVETILAKSKVDSYVRNTDVSGINKSKHLGFQNEGEKSKWDRLTNYSTLKSDEDEK